MGIFHALLLAVSLGCTSWSAVVAEPQGSDWPPSNNTAGIPSKVPYHHLGSRPLPNSITTSPSTLPASIPYTEGPSHPPYNTASWPHHHQSQQPPSGAPTGPSHHWPAPSPTPTGGAGTTSGGLLIDTSPIPTAIRTYFLNGQPIVAGSGATVIQGTTFSIAASGTATELYANGKPESLTGAIIGGGGGRIAGSQTGSGGVASATGNAAASSAAGSAGHANGVKLGGGVVGFVVAIVGMRWL